MLIRQIEMLIWFAITKYTEYIIYNGKPNKNLAR